MSVCDLVDVDMKTITLSEEIVKELEELSTQFGIPIEEIVKRGMIEYLRELKPNLDLEFEAIGFGMWSERADMKNSAEWVWKLREKEWN